MMISLNNLARSVGNTFSVHSISAKSKNFYQFCRRQASTTVPNSRRFLDEWWRKLISDNRFFLSKPNTEKHQEEGERGSIRYATTSVQGWRAQQEDAHNCILDFEKGCSLFAVYDGHGGSEVSEYTSKNLPSHFKSSGLLKSTDNDIEASLIKCFADFDRSLTQKEVLRILNATRGETSTRPGYESGTTACVAFLFEDSVVVANVGDSRAVLCRDGVAHDLSADHKPEDHEEMVRIRKAGGTVTTNGRINGGLNLSRAFGDHSYKSRNLPPEAQMVSPIPDVVTADLSSSDTFLIIACDGIWNSLTSQEVVDFVNARIDARTLSEIGAEICDFCCASSASGGGPGYDNMTIIIVALKQDG